MRRPAWLSVRWWSSRSILAVSFCAFAAVLCILLGSNRYMADCVQQEAQAKDELASLIALGQQLADASDLLTNEVRAYAETEDITHLDNYWTEVLATRQRDEVIQTLENGHLPDGEAALLAQAKHEIMSPIERFRQQTSGRLAAEVACAAAGRRSRRFGCQIP